MNPLLLDIPLRFETERLILRVPRQSVDSSIVNQAIKDSMNQLKTWLPFAQTTPTVEETEINLREAYIKFLKRDGFRYLIFNNSSKDFIGVVSFEDVNWDVPKCQIGYWINTKHSGNGYMLEAVKSVTEIGFNLMKFRRIEIRCESTNLKSRSIPEKLGFRLEGTLKDDDLSADGSSLTDTCVYAKLYKDTL